MNDMVIMMASLFSVIAIGAAAGWRKLFSLSDARTFASFTFMIAMPFAVFASMSRTPPPTATYLGLMLAYLIALGVVSTLSYFAARRLGGLTVQEAGAAVFTTTCGNAVFLGLPIALSFEAWTTGFLTLMLLEGTVVFAIGSALMTTPDRGAEAAPNPLKNLVDAGSRVLRNPIVVAGLSGILVSAVGISLPALVATPLNLVAAIASPMGLFVLGLYLTCLPPGEGAVPPPLLATLLALKLAVFPAMTGGLTYLFTQDANLAAVAAFFTCLPPAVSSVLLSAQYRQWEAATAGVVIKGTLVGLVTSTIVLVMSMAG